MTSRAPAIVALAVAAVGLAIGAVLLLIGSDTGDDGDRADIAGPVGIQAWQGPRDRPQLALDPLLDPSYAEPPRLEVPPSRRTDERAGLDDRDREIVSVFDQAIAGVEAKQHRSYLRSKAAAVPAPAAPTSDPEDVEVTGLVMRPPPPADPGAAPAAIVPIDPPDPLKPPPTPATVKPPPADPMLVESGLPEEVVRRFIRRAMAPIRACYEDALIAQPALEGTVQVRFTIGADGRVASAAGTGLVPAVATCVADVVRGIQFPRPDGGGAVSVRYPFVFRNRP